MSKFYESNQLLKIKYNVNLNIEPENNRINLYSGENLNIKDIEMITKYIEEEKILHKYKENFLI